MESVVNLDLFHPGNPIRKASPLTLTSPSEEVQSEEASGLYR